MGKKSRAKYLCQKETENLPGEDQKQEGEKDVE